MRLLLVFLDALFPPRPTQVLVRNASEESVRALGTVRTIAGVTALIPYRDPLAHALIVEAKFHDNERATKLLGSLLSSAIPEGSTLIPIPLSDKRRRERGYNQVERIASASGYPVALHTLYRKRETLPQTTLSRYERLNNVAGAFEVEDVNPNLHYVLIDDVVTTGATLQAGLTALKESGATVSALALAY